MRISIIALVAALSFLGCVGDAGSSDYAEVEVTARYKLSREQIFMYEFTPISAPHITCLVTVNNSKGISCFPKAPK